MKWNLHSLDVPQSLPLCYPRTCSFSTGCGWDPTLFEPFVCWCCWNRMMKTWLLISCRRRDWRRRHWQGCVGSSPPVHLLHHTWEHGRRFAGRRPSLPRKLLTRHTQETGGAYRGWSRPLPLYVVAEARGDSRKAVPADPSLFFMYPIMPV